MELRIRDVSRTYANGVQAPKDVTLTIPAGMYGLPGPNGAGKLTLMRTLATLQDPGEGSIHLGDIDVVRQKDEMRKTPGYLPQEFLAGRTVAHVHGDTAPGPGFETVEPDLEDVHFSTVTGHIGRRRAPLGVA